MRSDKCWISSAITVVNNANTVVFLESRRYTMRSYIKTYTKKGISITLAMIISIFASANISADELSLSASALSYNASTVKMAAPLSLNAVVSGSSVKLTWGKVTGAEKYRVYIYDSNDKKYKKFKDVDTTSCTISSLKKGRIYYFKVAAVKGGQAGKKSDAIGAKIKKAPVNLYSLDWNTDYNALTNAVAYKVADGDVKVDLDGDGIPETINFTHMDTSKKAKEILKEEFEYINPVIPYINGKTVDVKFNEPESGYYWLSKYIVNFPSGYFYICDIDSSDRYKEIAFVPHCYTDDYNTVFFRYYDNALHFIGSITYDSPNAELEYLDGHFSIGDMNITWGRSMIIDGSGVITAAIRLAPQTWFGYTQYEYDPETAEIRPLANKGVYPYGYSERNSYAKAWARVKRNWISLDWVKDVKDCFLTRDITVYRSPSKTADSYLMKAQPAIATGQYQYSPTKYYREYEDYNDKYKDTWIYITAKDGTCGWFYVGSYDNWDGLFTVEIGYD